MKDAIRDSGDSEALIKEVSTNFETIHANITALKYRIDMLE